MSRSAYFADADDAGAAVETLKAFGIRAVMVGTTVAELKTGSVHTEWEVIALELPAQQSDPARVVEPDEQDRISSQWWDDDFGRGWDRDRD